MLKRDITYTDFNGDEVKEAFYFNINKSEVVEMEFGYKGGMQEFIQKVIKAEDNATLISEFKKLILLSYGEKSPDGKRFIKNEEMREAFSQTAAFDALFMELATNDSAAAEFIKGVLPVDLRGEMDKVSTLQAPAVGQVKLNPPNPNQIEV